MKKKYLILFIIFAILALAMDAFIIYQSCLNGSQSTTWSGHTVEIIKNIINSIFHNAINDSNISTFTNVIRKLVGHFGLFFISGIFTSLAIYYLLYENKLAHYYKILIMLPFGLSVAIITEVIQLSVPNRSGQLTDVLIDFAGYFTAIILVNLILLLIFYKKKTNKK